MKYFDAYLAPEIFPRFAISSFLTTSQRGIVFESEEKNIFISCSWRLVELIKSIKALWVLDRPPKKKNQNKKNTKHYVRKNLSGFFLFVSMRGELLRKLRGSHQQDWKTKSWENHSKRDCTATMSSGSKLNTDLDKGLTLPLRLVQRLLYSPLFLKRNCCNLNWRLLELSCVLFNGFSISERVSDSLLRLTRKC